MDSRGATPRPTTIQEMVNLLLAAHGSTPVQKKKKKKKGKSWVTNLVNRHFELSN